MDISIRTITAHSGWVGGVGQIKEDETSATAIISGSRSDSNGVVEFFVHNNIVTAPEGKIGKVTSQVTLAEKNWSGGGIDGKKLLFELETRFSVIFESLWHTLVMS